MSSDQEYIEDVKGDDASVQSDDLPNENVRLLMKTNSLRNNVIECDSLGFHYQVSTDTSGIKATRSTFISKLIPSTDEQIPLAEWKRKLSGRDTIKLSRELTPGGSSPPDFVPTKEYLRRPKFSFHLKACNAFNFMFTAKNGKSYTWKIKLTTLKLHCDESDKVIVKYHFPRYLINKRSGSLELICDWEDILDDIVVSFVVMEKLRREEERAIAAAAAS